MTGKVQHFRGELEDDHVQGTVTEPQSFGSLSCSWASTKEPEEGRGFARQH
jgi:hypothetical protein